MEVFDAILNSVPAWWAAIGSLLLAIKPITMLTPTKVDNVALNMVLRILNTFALNVGRDKNADAE